MKTILMGLLMMEEFWFRGKILEAYYFTYQQQAH